MGGSGSGGHRKNSGRKKGILKQLKGQDKLGNCFSEKDDGIDDNDDDNKRQREEEEASEEENRKKKAREEKKKAEEEKKPERERKEKEEKKKREEKKQSDGLDRLQTEMEETVNNRNYGGGGGGGGGGDGDEDDEDYSSDEDCDEDLDAGTGNNEEPDDDSDDEGDDDDGGVDNNVPTNNNNNPDQIQRRNRAKCKPPPGSVLCKCLKRKKKEVTTEKDPTAKKLWVDTGRAWHPPEHGAVEKVADPNCFCKETPLMCCFAPFNSIRPPEGKKNVKDFACTHCNHQGWLESNGWYWRAQHMFADSVWPLHQRIVCRKNKNRNKKGCGETLAVFHPKFMEQLPTVIAERFPFLATPSGVGIHVAMMDQFPHLAAGGILFTACSNSINEMKKTRHHRDHCSHLDLLGDRVAEKGTPHNCYEDGFVPQPFAPHKSAGDCNGTLLKPSLMKTLFLQVMGVLEVCMQESFQLHPDESESSDHSFKFAKQAIASIRAGRAFQAAHDSIGLAGMCNFNRFCHTKSNDEIRAFIKLCKKVRINAGATVLKRTEGDGGGDRSVWPLAFPELKNNIVECIPSSKNGKTRAALTSDECVVLHTKANANDWAVAVAGSNDALHRPKVCCGLDAEWNMDETRDTARVISLCIPGSKVAVLDLTSMGWPSDDPRDMPLDLKKLLEKKTMVPVGVNVSGDQAKLKNLGVCTNKSVELGQLAKQLEPDQGHKVSELADRCLDLDVGKKCQNSDWRELSERRELQECAAVDSHLHLRLHTELIKRMRVARTEGIMPNPTIVPGAKAQLACRRRVCAVGESTFVGGKDGELRKCGEPTVGSGKGSVKIERVKMNGARPAFPHRHSPDSACFQKSWDIADYTIQELLDQHPEEPVMPWPTGRMKIMLPSMDQCLPTVEEQTEAAEEEQQRTENTQEEQEQQQPTDDFVPFDEDLEAEAASDKACDRRSNMLTDRFHAFDNFPASRDENIKPFCSLMRRLVTQASIEFDLDDWNDMTRFLAEHKGMTDIDEVLDGFHFDREWWCQRARIYPPPPERGAKNVETTKDFIESNPAMKDAMTDKLSECLDGPTELCEEGKPSECEDVEMCQHDGKDKCGLSKWLRRRGSNRSENVHQKMRVAFGPHGVGAEVGHHLLLLVCHRCNINTATRRKGAHNFGTPHCNPIDRIHLRMMQTFKIDVFPNHTNQSLFKPVKGFVAVGVGPLNHNDDHAKKGLPHTHCKGDMLFPAKRMGLAGPPLHVCHPKEKKTFNDFMRDNPKVTTSNWQKPSKIHLEKADCQDVFPKLPSMLQNCHSKWKVTQQTVALKDSVKIDCYNLSKKLGLPADEPLNPAAAFQKENSDESGNQDVAGNNNDNDFPAEPPEDVDVDALPVAPLAAPGNRECVASGDGRKRSNKKCSGAPFGCPPLADDCCKNGLQDWRKCESTMGKSTLVNVPDSVVEQKRLMSVCRNQQNQIRVNRCREKKRAAAAAKQQQQQAAEEEEEEEESSD